MRREGLKQDEKVPYDAVGFDLPGHGLVDEDHERGDSGVEAEAVQIFGHFLDAGMERLELVSGRLDFRDRRAELDLAEQFVPRVSFGSELLFKFGFALFVHEKTPDAAQEAINPSDTFVPPPLPLSYRPLELFL